MGDLWQGPVLASAPGSFTDEPGCESAITHRL
jgi:hypothetical protein